VRANGAACDFRYRCFGCAHFRTDPSYLPELRAYLSKLLATRERLVAALPDLADWARRDAIPASEEIDTVRRLITACEHALARLDPPIVPPSPKPSSCSARAEQNGHHVPRAVPRMVAQPAPAVFPAVAAETGRSR